jgi:uncharacterized damage-inducible protein DinB
MIATDAPVDTAADAAPALDDERADLLAELAHARHFLVFPTRHLTDEQAGARTTASALCLGGLIKHVASTEQAWLRFALEGSAAMPGWELPEGATFADLMAGRCEKPAWLVDRENDFRMLPGETLAGVVARYEAVAARTEEIVRTVPDLGLTHQLPDAPWDDQPPERWSVRRVLLHVLAETTQHAGHADMLREAIDGATSM